MKVGKSHNARKLKKTHTPHAHQVQLGPVLAMIHSTAAARGRPSATDTSKPLSASITNRRGVTRLKPKRASSLNFRHSEKGSPRAPSMSNTEARDRKSTRLNSSH